MAALESPSGLTVSWEGWSLVCFLWTQETKVVTLNMPFKHSHLFQRWFSNAVFNRWWHFYTCQAWVLHWVFSLWGRSEGITPLWVSAGHSHKRMMSIPLVSEGRQAYFAKPKILAGDTEWNPHGEPFWKPKISPACWLTCGENILLLIISTTFTLYRCTGSTSSYSKS